LILVYIFSGKCYNFYRDLTEKYGGTDSRGDRRTDKRTDQKPYQSAGDVSGTDDDFTPMDFVVEVLMRIFDKEESAAVTLMMSIHRGSYAVAGVYPRDIAQTKAGEAIQWARSEGYPLKVEAVRQP
jgi:ATP-dependent Clp protease adaptor protein ClpS